MCAKLQAYRDLSKETLSVAPVIVGRPRLGSETENQMNVDGYWILDLSIGNRKQPISLFPIAEDELSVCDVHA